MCYLIIGEYKRIYGKHDGAFAVKLYIFYGEEEYEKHGAEEEEVEESSCTILRSLVKSVLTRVYMYCCYCNFSCGFWPCVLASLAKLL